VLLRGLILDLIDDGTVPTARSRLHGVLNEDRQDTNDRVRRSCGIGSEAVLLQAVVVNAGDEVTCLRLRRRKGAVRTTKDAIVIDGGCSYYIHVSCVVVFYSDRNPCANSKDNGAAQLDK